jgi:hypothetical protein
MGGCLYFFDRRWRKRKEEEYQKKKNKGKKCLL